LAYFDTFHTSPPKPLAEKPTPSRVAEKPSPPAVAEKPTVVPPSASRGDTQAAAPAELPANSPAKQHPWCDGRQSAEAPEPLPPPQGKTLNLHYAGRIT